MGFVHLSFVSGLKTFLDLWSFDPFSIYGVNLKFVELVVQILCEFSLFVPCAIHAPTSYDAYGKIDYSWQDCETGELIVVDYKSTARAEPEYLKPDYYRDGLGSKYKKQ